MSNEGCGDDYMNAIFKLIGSTKVDKQVLISSLVRFFSAGVKVQTADYSLTQKNMSLTKHCEVFESRFLSESECEWEIGRAHV